MNPFSVLHLLLLTIHTMSVTTAFHSSLCIPQQQKASLSHQPNTPLASKPSLFQTNPLYKFADSTLTHKIKEKIICLELLGIDSGKALSLNPVLHTTSLSSIQSIIYYLHSKGILQKDLRRIFGMCPLILTSDIKSDLDPVFRFLSVDLNVPNHNLRRVINKCPRLLTSSVRDQLKPALFYLQRLGFKDLNSLAYQDPVLLVSSVENTLIPKLKFLESIGFTKKEVTGMVLRCPGLFTYSIENNFKPKYDYFVGEMNGDIVELKEFPQYFAFSLENRIKVRHMEVVESGANLCLATMLKSSDEEFHELLVKHTV